MLQLITKLMDAVSNSLREISPPDALPERSGAAGGALAERLTVGWTGCGLPVADSLPLIWVNGH